MSDEQRERAHMIRRSVPAIGTAADLTRIRHLRFTELGYSRETWREITALGWLGLRVPESDGGAALGAFEYRALAEELGRALVPEPLITAALAARLYPKALEEDRLNGERVSDAAWPAASEAALFVTRQSVQLHGGVGCTDEHDIGLYLRKALVLSRAWAARRPIARAGRSTMSDALHDPRRGDSSFYRDDYNALSDDEFRALTRGFLAANHPPELRNPEKRLRWEQAEPWYMALSTHGWLAPAWPREHGGMGLDATKQLIYVNEFAEFGAARNPDHGIILLGPLLIRYGTYAQKKRFLPKILAGEELWCQGYSEPEAGSDLAGLRTRAVLDGDEWVINGQKTWTTLATEADYIFVLARTKPDNLVGEVDRGWTMAKTLLGFERIFLGSPRQSAHALEGLRRAAEHVGCAKDPAFRERFVRLALDLEDHRALYESFAEQLKRGETLGPDVSFLEIHGSELFQRITELTVEICGEEGAFLEPTGGDRGLNPAGLFLSGRAATIYGGTSEVQRNIIAKNILRLPG